MEQNGERRILSPAEVAAFIDHTILKPDAREDEVKKVCAEAKAYGFASVCVNPGYIELAAKELQGSGVAACAVAAFPLGALTPGMKAAQTRSLIALGAQEVDMVVNIGAVKSGDWSRVREDIAAVTEAAGGLALVKVIIETCLLTDEEKVRACRIAKESGADFVKTSTGFSSGGATVEDVRLMRATVGDGMGVKASGGIRSYADAAAMLAAGATRLGTSAGVSIVNG